MSYFKELTMFLAQTETTDLKKSHYLKKYLDLDVKIGFGQGVQARIPWIAFINELDTIQKGIYPVYLFFKEKKLLILAYGISETFQTDRNWNIPEAITIEEYFKENNLGNPIRYGTSQVFKIYNIYQLNEFKINQDLNEIIDKYKSTLNLAMANPLNLEIVNTPNIAMENPLPSIGFQYKVFNQDAMNSGLHFNEITGLRYTASLITKPFDILTGLSGSGKTKLALSFARWLCEDQSQYKLIPVGADWTNREPLLGYPNALKNGEYIIPETGALELILAAIEDLSKPYFLILDEMNLSHVERYFADFLSAMESEEEIALHPGTREWDNCPIPSKIKLPKNLYIIGTVNIDETTYMFSPKVLDRANVIEFRISETELRQYLNEIKPLNLELLSGQGAAMADAFVELSTDKGLMPKELNNMNVTLINFFKELKKTGAEFGYRSASEISRFVSVANKLEPHLLLNNILDFAIMQKLLPKVHGSRSKLNSILTSLAKLCIHNGLADFIGKDEEFRKYFFVSEETLTAENKNKIIYPISFEKIARMHKNAIDNGFTSYAEA